MLCIPHGTVAADGGESERTTSSKSDGSKNTPCVDELALDQQVQASIGIPGEFRARR